jgi:hypothetical protein
MLGVILVEEYFRSNTTQLCHLTGHLSREHQPGNILVPVMGIAGIAILLMPVIAVD